MFSRTKHGADKIVRQLEAAGIPAGAIHGNKSQPQRERALAAFKSGDMPVLVATDIAARGIDIPGVSHVVNFDLPDVPEQYVHRIGRTARAGANGIAIAFCAPDERGNLRDIERTTRRASPSRRCPADFAASAEALKRLKPAPKAPRSLTSARSPSPTAAMTASSAATAMTGNSVTRIVARVMPRIARARRTIMVSAATLSTMTARARHIGPKPTARQVSRRVQRARPRAAATSVPAAGNRSASFRAGGGSAAVVRSRRAAKT